MIKNAINKFFSNLKYYFAPLVILLIFSLFGVLATISGFNNAIGTIVDGFNQVKTDTTLEVKELTIEVTNELKDIIFKEGIDSSLEVLSTEGEIEKIIQEALDTATGEINNYEGLLVEVINEAISSIAYGFIFFTIDISVGLIVGFYFTKYLIRHNMIKRSFKESIKSLALGSILFTIELVVIGLLIKLFKKLVIIYIILGLIVFAIGSLFKAFLIQRKNGLKIKEIVNTKNVIKLFVSDLIVIVLGFLFATIILLITNNIIALLIALPFIELSLIQISLMSESYVSSLVNN